MSTYIVAHVALYYGSRIKTTARAGDSLRTDVEATRNARKASILRLNESTRSIRAFITCQNISNTPKKPETINNRDPF